MLQWQLMRNYTVLVGVVMAGTYLMFRYWICPIAHPVFHIKLQVPSCGSFGKGIILQVFDLKSLVWSNLKLKPNADKFEETSSLDILPAISGHNVVNWGNKLFLIGGHSKKVADKITVLFIDLETHLCSVVETSGKVPIIN